MRLTFEQSRVCAHASMQGQEVAREIGAKYAECSAKTGTGVADVFGLALRESMRGQWGKRLKKKGCVIT